MVRTITAITPYETKRKFQDAGPEALVTIITRNDKGEDVASRHAVKDVVLPGIEMTVRNGWPTKAEGTFVDDRARKDHGKLQPSWMATAYIRDKALVIE